MDGLLSGNIKVMIWWIIGTVDEGTILKKGSMKKH